MGETYYIIMIQPVYGKEIVDETEDLEEAMRYCYEYEIASGIPHEVRQAMETSAELVEVWEE